MRQHGETEPLSRGRQGARLRPAGAGLLAAAVIAGAGWRIATVRVQPAEAPPPRTPVQLILALERTAAADPHPREAAEQLGAACLQLGHFLSARAALRRAEARGSDSPWLWQQLAWCALRLDYRAEALHAYRRLLRYQPDLPNGYLRLAAAALRMGEPAAARSALQAMPDAARRTLMTAATPEARLQLVRCLLLMNEAGPAEDCLRLARVATERMPAEAAGYFVAAQASLKLGHPRDALRWLETAIRLAPRQADLFALRGDALLALDEPQRREEARAAYARAVELEPTLGPACYRLGRLALAGGRWEEAARAFSAAHSLGTEPLASLRGEAQAAEGAHQSLVAVARWAEYREEAGDTAAARALYRRLLTDPRTALAATLRLADLDARENRLRDAVARLETAARQTPRSAAVWSALARAYRRSARTRRALAAWRRVAALDAAAAPDACRERAALYESLADFDHAEQAYEEALRRSPDAVSLRLYGSLLLRRRHLGDRLPRAIAQLERAVALAPDDPAGFTALGSAYEAAGRDAEALVALRHAIDLAPGAGTPYLAAGRLARRLGQPEEGRELLAMYRRYRQAEQELESLKAAVAGRPGDAAARLALADYYFTARDFSRAAAEYERALIQSDPTLSPGAQRAARRHLAFAYEQLARREEAAVQLALAERQ